MNNNDKLIFNTKTHQFLIIDKNNSIVINTFSNNIDFSRLPNNVLSNPKLYLGKEYNFYNIDFEWIVNLLINNLIMVEISNSLSFINKEGYWFYSYDILYNEITISSNTIITPFNINYGFNFIIIDCLCNFILRKHYNW